MNATAAHPFPLGGVVSISTRRRRGAPSEPVVVAALCPDGRSERDEQPSNAGHLGISTRDGDRSGKQTLSSGFHDSFLPAAHLQRAHQIAHVRPDGLDAQRQPLVRQGVVLTPCVIGREFE